MNGTRKKRRINPSGNSEEKDEIIFHNVYYPSLKVHCDFCDKDIARHTRIVDAETMDTDMCVNCFIGNEENNKRSKNKSYHVINKLNFPLYEESWTAEEDLLLLEGLEKFGFGNWGDIAEHLATGKTPENVQDHYERVYIAGKDTLPPTEVISKRDAKQNLIIKPSNALLKSNDEIESKRKKNSKQYSDKKDGANNVVAGSVAAQQNVGGLTQSKDTNVNAAEIVGFMPLRGDFDYEYDNEAELFLAEMEFNDDDKPEEIELKMKILEIYNVRLDERIKRKNFVIERDMLDLKKQNLLDRIRTKEEKEIYNSLKIFARFNTPEEHEKLVQGIYKEKMIKRKIEELRFYKKLGLKSFEEVELYLEEKKKKDEAYQKKQKQSEYLLYDNKVKISNAARRTRLREPDSKEANEKKNKVALTQLNEKEVNLCNQAGITPHEFLLVKDLLVRECLKEGYLSRNFLDQSIKLEFKDKASEVFDFLVTNKVILEKS